MSPLLLALALSGCDCRAACPCGTSCACVAPATPPAPPPLPPAPPALVPPPLPPPPALWQLRDAAGITWTHKDKAYLERFVHQRDAARPTYPTYSPYFAPFSRASCPSGGCR